MLVITGFFENGVFTPEKTLTHIKGRQRASLTIEETDEDQDEHKKRWKKIIHDIRTCDEMLEGEPERMKFFKTTEQLESL
jgi:predicted DNA-binding antitoxin AbrB/MazE fold protein